MLYDNYALECLNHFFSVKDNAIFLNIDLLVDVCLIYSADWTTCFGVMEMKDLLREHSSMAQM